MTRGKPAQLLPAALIGDGQTPYAIRLRLTIPAPRRRPLGSRWAAWVRRMAARYGTRSPWHRPVEMWLAQFKIHLTLRRDIVHWRPITLAPRIALGLVMQTRMDAGNGPLRWTAGAAVDRFDERRITLPMEPVLSTLRRTIIEERRLWRISTTAIGVGDRRRTEARTFMSMVVQPLTAERVLTRQVREAVQTELIMRRLMTRGERVEGFGPSDIRQRRVPSTPTVLPAATFEKVEEPAIRLRHDPGSLAMVLRRFNVAPEGPEMSGRQRTRGIDAAPASTGMRDRLAQGPPQTPAPDVNRLADQVMQTIDRRLTAWRERMGRV
jgi:hypothetical protein